MTYLENTYMLYIVYLECKFSQGSLYFCVCYLAKTGSPTYRNIVRLHEMSSFKFRSSQSCFSSQRWGRARESKEWGEGHCKLGNSALAQHPSTAHAEDNDSPVLCSSCATNIYLELVFPEIMKLVFRRIKTQVTRIILGFSSHIEKLKETAKGNFNNVLYLNNYIKIASFKFIVILNY